MIEISRLSFEYRLAGAKSSKVLKNIDLHIGVGERVAIVGPSGAGKSTFLKCINRLLRPMMGSIKIQNQEIMNLSSQKIRKIRQRLGMIFQNFNLIQRISAIDNVLLGRLSFIPNYRKYLYGFAYSSQDYEIALENLRQVQIEKFALRRADRLSGGQQQRIGIARALTQEPEVILADEPVSNLDPKIKTEILELLLSICDDKNLTLLISMHEIELVKRFVSRVVGFSNGQIVFDGTPHELGNAEYKKIYS